MEIYTPTFFVNAINLSLIALNNSYKSLIEKKKKYIVLSKRNLDRKNANIKIINEVRQEIGSISNLMKETLVYNNISKDNMIDKKMNDYLLKVFNHISFTSLFRTKTLLVRDNNTTLSNDIFNIEEYFKKLFSLPIINYEEILWTNEINSSEEVINSSTIGKLFLEYLCFPIAIIIAINSPINQNALDDTKAIDQIIELYNELIPDIEYEKTTTIGDVTAPIIARKRLEHIYSTNESYEEKFDKILDIKGLTNEEKIDEIINSNITGYENIFNYLITKNPNYERIIPIIINSNITNIENIFNYLISLDGIKRYDLMEYILNSDVITNHELFSYIIQCEKFTIKEKVWYSLLIPNTTIENIFDELLDDKTKDIIIENIIDIDLIPFDTLFTSILKCNAFNSKDLIKYLVYYNNNSSYNAITLEEIINYTFSIKRFTFEEHVECIWLLLKNYPLETREEFILSYFNITKQEYLDLFGLNFESLDINQKIILKLYELINQEKEDYILEHYDFNSKNELDITVAIVAAEGYKSYEDLYWVSNTIFNRITNVKDIYMGTNPYSQVTRPSQFVVYENGSFKKYLNPTTYYNIKQANIAKQAFYDMFYANYQGIKHNYVQFRAWGSNTEFPSECVVKYGNLYGDRMNETSRIEYDNLTDEDIKNDLTRKLFLATTFEE